MSSKVSQQESSFEEPYIRNVFFPVDIFTSHEESPAGTESRPPCRGGAKQGSGNTRIVESLNASRTIHKAERKVPSSFCVGGERINRSKYGIGTDKSKRRAPQEGEKYRKERCGPEDKGPVTIPEFGVDLRLPGK